MIEGEQDLPLAFVVPPGWPEPDIHWRAGHQGFDPDPAWVPRAGVPPRPAGWKLWRKNDAVWNELVARRRRVPLVWLWVGSCLFVGGALACVVQALLGVDLGLWPLIWIGGMLVGFCVIVPSVSELTDAQSRVIRDIRATAPDTERAIAAELYVRYLNEWWR